MKRNAALASLSRDHHQVLVVAQRLSRAGNQTAAEARQAFARYWVAHGRRHFRLEEEVLLPSFAAYGDPHHPVVLRALGDHVAIRQKADTLVGGAELSLAAVHEVGARLTAHVRLEERELFPMIERAMPPGELLTVGRKLAHAAHAPSGAAHTSKLDLREFERRHHVSVLFERLDALGCEDHLFVVCADDPEPLRQKVEDWCPDEFDWLWIGTGPDVWGAELTVRRRSGRGQPRP